MSAEVGRSSDENAPPNMVGSVAAPQIFRSCIEDMQLTQHQVQSDGCLLHREATSFQGLAEYIASLERGSLLLV